MKATAKVLPGADAGAPSGAGLETVERKDRGVYYTPDALADLVVELALGPVLQRADRARDLANVRVLDPAVGGGAFLIAAVRAVRRRLRQLMPAAPERRLTAALSAIVRSGFCGIDLDPLAVRVTDFALRLECVGTTATEQQPFARVYAADALDRTAGIGDERWDAILCNPPWGKIKPNVREYYGALDPVVRLHQGAQLHDYLRREHDGRRAEYDAYAQETLRRASALRKTAVDASARHRDGTKAAGDADYYRFFLERILEWSSEATRLGLIVPIAFLNTEGASGLRRAYLERGTFEQLLTFENRERLFPIHGMYRFSVAVYRRGARRGIVNAAVRLVTVAEARKASTAKVRLSRRYLSRASPFYGIVPIVGDAGSRDLFERMRTAHPALTEAKSAWNACFRRECDMTQDAKKFVEAASLRIDRYRADGSIISAGRRYLPVYEGRMVEQFDSCAKVYVSGAGRSAVWRPSTAHDTHLRPHYYMHERDVAELQGSSSLGVRPGYCDISGHANQRTIIAALIPSGAICGNKVPVVEFSSADVRLPKLWIAAANALVVDWVARRLVSTTVNFFYWRDIPVPFIPPASGEGKLIAAVVDQLHTLRRDENARMPLRVFLDAYVAHRFGLSDRDVRLVLDDFPHLGPASAAGRLVLAGLDALRTGTTAAQLLRVLRKKAP